MIFALVTFIPTRKRGTITIAPELKAAAKQQAAE
jgi:hypothetical protein